MNFRDLYNIEIDGDKLSRCRISERLCTSCGHWLAMYDRYDAIFCPVCNEWMERGCTDEKCEYCKDRPLKPLEIDKFN